MSDHGSPIRYVIVRRVGDFDEYLQDDGNFGPLADYQSRDYGRIMWRRDVTRVFFERDHAELFRSNWSLKHPTTAEVVPLEIRRLP
jgi:hypothetical protein